MEQKQLFNKGDHRLKHPEASLREAGGSLSASLGCFWASPLGFSAVDDSGQASGSVGLTVGGFILRAAFGSACKDPLSAAFIVPGLSVDLGFASLSFWIEGLFSFKVLNSFLSHVESPQCEQPP